MVCALVLFGIFPLDSGNRYLSAIVTGIIEEVAKLAIVAFFVKQAKTKYILNGLLIGSAVGAGFAAFETAGYGLRFLLFSYGGNIAAMNDLLIMRGWMAIGAHVVWAAITGAALVMVKKDSNLSKSHFLDRKFLRLFVMPIIFHAVWNSPIDFPIALLVRINLKYIILIVAAWLFVFPLINAGLKQVSEISRKAYGTDDSELM